MMETNDENTGANMTTALEFDLVKNKAAARDKRMRSKSLGPGGLGGLREGSGNRIKVILVKQLRLYVQPLSDCPLAATKIYTESCPPTVTLKANTGTTICESIFQSSGLF